MNESAPICTANLSEITQIFNKQGILGCIRVCRQGQRGQGLKGPPFKRWTLAESFMNKRVFWKCFRVYRDGLARITLIRAGNLQSKTALGTANQYGLALAQIMEPLEEMNAA